MKIQLRATVPVVLFFVLAAVGLICLHARFKDFRETIVYGSSLFGGGAAVYALLLNVQARRAGAANRFIERYNEPSFENLRKALAEHIRGKDVDEHSRRSLLNFFEELALAVNNREADEQLLRGFFLSISGKCYRSVEAYIKTAREQGSQPTAFCEYESLYKRWNG